MLSNKKLGEEGKEGRLELWHLSSQATVMHDEVLFSWRWLNTCLLKGSGE